MTVDEVVEESFEKYGQGPWFGWRKASGVETQVFQDNGTDIVIGQDKGEGEVFFRDYSGPGYALFAALLAYHKQETGALPTFEEIEHIKGNEGYPSDDGETGRNQRLMRRCLTKPLPRCENGVVTLESEAHDLVVGGDMGGLFYQGFVEEENFVIAMPTEQGSDCQLRTILPGKEPYIEKFRRITTLNLDDALRVMKLIYFAAGDKEGLKMFYQRACML